MRTFSSCNRRTTVLILAVSLLSLAVGAAAAPAERTSRELLVGFEGPADAALLAKHGASVKRVLGDSGVVLVDAPAGDAFAQALARAPGVLFVTPNQPLRLDSSSWDASSWDASSWDASSWDASSWDASSWDASSWDASSWDASSWDASSWDASSWDASSWDASSWDASSWDASGEMDPGYGEQWGIGAAHFNLAWNTTYGDGTMTICVLDTGVDHAHPDLQVNLLRDANGAYGHNAMDGSTNVMDEVGHGTHVAGILAATGGNGLGVTGLVRAKILTVKVMGPNGGSEADLIAGLDHCIARGARVAAMSLHVTQPDAALEAAIQRAQAAGILLVASSGNDGAGSVAYPAAYPGVLSVGAVKPDGTVASFSNGGANLDLVAPGYRIGSTALGGGYIMGTGTSQAVPFVVGAAALVWYVKPTLTASQVAGILTGSANDLGPAGHDAAYGHGAVDAYAAILQAQAS